MATMHKLHTINGTEITELTDTFVISDAQQFLDIIFNLPSDIIALHKVNLDESFFELRSGLAGEILQKATNYRIRLAIVGDFSMYESKALRDFIYESNKSNKIIFVDTLNEALKRFAS